MTSPLLQKKEPLRGGAVVSKTLALPEALWEALDAEVEENDAKSRSSLATDLLVWAINELRAEREKAKR